ncbi:hypothetical protein H0H87_010742 [Tephrocybe sp. NHM501043]|nr:hypothetical protein H0H87_010742 [Tephrocybe sp. NHM501043]
MTPGSSLFALLIGIDHYIDPAIPDLCGAVHDADAVENFLTSFAGVPKDRIMNLRDEQATRNGIMSAMRSLANNNAINPEDPILIYYAGHGSEAPSPIPRWTTSSANDMIQMLLPHDFDSRGSNRVLGQGVFDIALSSILGTIAENKSNNITVIFDCCHSGSGTREYTGNETSTIRGIKLHSNYTLPTTIVQVDSFAPSVRAKTGLDSHVLLAACKQGQTASEVNGRGVFTEALLRLLKQEGIHKLTYADVIAYIQDLPSQNPQCEGVNQYRKLFDSKVYGPHRTAYCINITPGKPNECILHAGEAHGITNGAVFDIFSDEHLTSVIGSVVAVDIASFTTRCSFTKGSLFSLSQSAHAVQTGVGKRQDIRLFIEWNEAFLDLFERLGQEIDHDNTDPSKRSFHLLDKDGDQPDLVLRARNGRVEFEIRNIICSQHGLTRMPFIDVRANETEHLFSILRSAADFYWYLRHSNKDASLTNKVKVECFHLTPTGNLSDDLEEIYLPDPDGRNLNIDGTIFIDTSKNDAAYGYKITNTCNIPLYAALFYFDISDLSIVACYLPGTAKNVDPSLPGEKSLTIGFGDGGWAPRTYRLRENQSVDVGFLKLYVSTCYIDYSSLLQQSPFETRIARGDGGPPKRRELWGALTIPVVQTNGVKSG